MSTVSVKIGLRTVKGFEQPVDEGKNFSAARANDLNVLTHHDYEEVRFIDKTPNKLKAPNSITFQWKIVASLYETENFKIAGAALVFYINTNRIRITCTL